MKGLQLIPVDTGKWPVPTDMNILEPPLVPKAGLCPKFKRREEITKGRRYG